MEEVVVRLLGSVTSSPSLHFVTFSRFVKEDFWVERDEDYLNVFIGKN